MTCSIDVPDSDYRPNPDRAIWIEGQLNEALLERLRPEILELTARSRDPITVFINSPGGQPEVVEGILSLLRQTTPDNARVSRIITVAAPKASSGAANLLSAGDLAIAYPESTLLYHGLRWSLPEQQLTGEWAKVGQTLPTFHEIAAAALARTSVHRFLFMVSAMRPQFAQHRADKCDQTLTDLGCFQEILRGKLSPVAQRVLERTVPLWESYNGLMLQFQKRLRRGRTVTKRYLRKLMLHASVAFEYEGNRDNEAWDGGLGRISDHFYFLNAYFDLGRLRDWVAGRDKPPVAEPDLKVDDLLQFRVFFLALCRALQHGENELTPMDAVWLGLVDTVRAS